MITNYQLLKLIDKFADAWAHAKLTNTPIGSPDWAEVEEAVNKALEDAYIRGRDEYIKM
jgi:hypothetical protein